ncbi:MAG: cytidylate kinase [Spirochaeta sp. LUC14_002_19_P3]|nr:MAG: cytidylate kinase [Spirochaeta sp. LUC14_002_19_P3]
MLNKLKINIAISGWSGCGNTTVSRTLANRLGLNFVNYTFRSIAEEDGITFEEVSRRAEQSDDYDLRVDEKQIKLAREKPAVLGSRLAIWLFEEADLKVFLTAPLETRARRIHLREGGEIDEIMANTKARDECDHNRYLRLYNIDNHDYLKADIVINTEKYKAEKVADIIEAAVMAIFNLKA